MNKDEKEYEDNIYRISDIVRGAHSLVIVVGQAGKDDLPKNVTPSDLLKQWGTRMWTWPEVMLSPANQKILVYTRGLDLQKPWQISKDEFPAQVWHDADVARQLMDHYQGTLSLSRLELVILALMSLKERVISGTTKYLDGDLSYALMGLLRRRPRVDRTDSAFQAFARLSLANDSDKLLERLICVLPLRQDNDTNSDNRSVRQTALGGEADVTRLAGEGPEDTPEACRRRHYWADSNDFWDANLWDIDPICQVAGIAKNDTVIIDGAYAATVHWDSFQRVAITTRETWTRLMARTSVRLAPGWFGLGILLIITGRNNPPAMGFGVIILIIAIIIILLLPMLILHIYGGKLWNSQPWLYGFEGYMPIEKLETKIFGFPNKRLTWTPYGSSLSRHQVNREFMKKEGECEGLDPYRADSYVRDRVDHPERAREDGMRIFTLVDTNTM